MVFAAAPDRAVAILVAGEVVEFRHHQPALGIGRIGVAGEVGAGDAERAVGRLTAVEDHAVEIGMGDVAAELAHFGPAGPDLVAALLVKEGPRRVRRQGEPEADLVGPGGHVVAVDVVGIGDPERGGRVVRGDQDVLGLLALGGLVREDQVGRHAGQASGWHLVWIARLRMNWLPVSTASSRKKQWPTVLKVTLFSTRTLFVPCTVTQRL